MVVDHSVVHQEVIINGRSCQKSVILVHNNQATTNSQNQVDSITRSGESRNIAPLDVIIVGGGLSGLIVA